MRLNKLVSSILVCFPICFSLLAATGCGEKDPGPSAETVQQSDRLSQIQKSTGGDWNKLTPEDRDYLVNTLAHGNEQSARMLLSPAPSTGPQQRSGQ